MANDQRCLWPQEVFGGVTSCRGESGEGMFVTAQAHRKARTVLCVPNAADYYVTQLIWTVSRGPVKFEGS